MSDSTHERRKRRPTILRGISQDLKHSEIAAQLGVNRWVVMNDLRYMQYSGDSELKRAQEAQERIRAEKQSVIARDRMYVKHGERFLRMTGMTIQEKTFQNMMDFYEPELTRVLKSGDQYAAIMRLPKSVRRTLMHNGIITHGRHKLEVASDARKYLISSEN